MDNSKLISALRQSAQRISEGSNYEWGHVGRCNCGHLVQSVCGLDENEIYKSFGPELNEWSEHTNDYCEFTGQPLEQVFDQLSSIGFSRSDVMHLENLTDARVLDHLPEGKRHLRRNDRDDVVLYMETLATVLES